ncbi:MAG: hypothetical protein JJ902_05340 [Roseibium sp.]|nr:hypothetical protein [Roseibium sp.]
MTTVRDISRMACPECDGTGAYKPDCWLCEGEMIIPVQKALDEGFAEDDLEDAYDGYCRCPSYECHGDSCDLCEGEGRVTQRTIDDEITRVLLCAMDGIVPARRYVLASGRISHSDELLARFAGVECRKRGWISWFVSIMGDEISLTPDGEVEARKRQIEWLREGDVSLRYIDDVGRFEDDGGPSRPEI